MQIVALSQLKENSYEACNHPSIAGSRLHRLDNDGSKRRRLRSRCVSGRLRQCRRCRGRRTSSCCPCCCCRATRGRCTPQGVLIIGQRVTLKICRGLSLADDARGMSAAADGQISVSAIPSSGGYTIHFDKGSTPLVTIGLRSQGHSTHRQVGNTHWLAETSSCG